MKAKKLFSVLLAIFLLAGCVIPAQATENAEETEEVPVTFKETIAINSTEEFLEFARNCTLDAWSQEKQFVLNADISLAGTDFFPIATFGGSFQGNGHTISGLNVTDSIVPSGLFRYLQPTAVVRDLNVEGTVIPTGDAKFVGGVVGYNQGTVENVTFTGTVEGTENVGGIAGFNEGTIRSCKTGGDMMGEKSTGGIAGYNTGVIESSTNGMAVNTQSVDPTIDPMDIDLDFSPDVSNLTNTGFDLAASDTGGIAGYSAGMILGCTNEGTIGYPHIGYNLGGILGRNCGYVAACQNNGDIYGRKDVGGIAGQIEPDIATILSPDYLQKLSDQFEQLGNLVSAAGSTASAAGSEFQSYLQTLAAYENQAKAALNSIHTGIAGSLGSLASGELPSAPDLSGFGILASAIQGLVNTTQGMGQAMGNSVADMGGSMNAITGQINSIAKTFELATEDAQKETVTDVSDADIAEVKSGKVYDCVNTGSVQADLNTGGIVGVMGLEAEADPEDDLNGGGTFSQRRQYELKAIVQNCVNQGEAISKQNYAGGICGRMELGLITASESYGNVTSTSGDYVGGIAGVVGGTIRGCYAKCTLSGRDYIGGIAGNGVAEDITGGTSLIANCYSMVEIESGKQFLGAISGGESGTYTGNYFVSDSLGGVNRVSYYALAEPISYDDMMRSEAMPRQMRKLTLTFRADGETVKTLSFDYGDSFDHTIYPAIPEKEGHYARWDTADLAELRFDTIVTAEYFPHITSLNSTDVRSSGNPVIFVQGQFQDGDLLKIAPGSADFPARSGQQLLEQWTLSIPADGLESHTIRYLPEEAVTVYLLKSGSWVKAETEEMGSYLAFSVSGAEATFAAIREETNWLMIAGIAAGIVGILAVCVILIRKARKKKQNAAAPHKQKPGKEKILVICAVLLLLVIIAGCILFFLPNTQKAVDTIRAYDILTAYMEQSEQVMELTVDSSISNREVDFSAMIHKTNAANTAVTSITENDRVLYFADSVVFLENGTAYKLNSSVPDYSLVLDQVTEAYSLVDVEAVNDVYTITAADDQATKLLQLLIPTAGDLLTDTNTLTVDLVTIENQLTEIHFTGAGNLADSVKTPFSLSAVIRILPDPAPIDIPAAVGQKLQSGDYQAQEVYSDDLVQLVAAWRNYSAKNPVGAVMTVDTDCGPVARSETFSLYQWKIEDTVIHGIEKADSTAYLSGGTICDGEGRSITTGTAEEMDISKVLDIVYGNFSNATFRCDPNEAGYIYTVTLNQTSMKELTSAIVPAAAELDISYEDGSIQLVIENDEIQSIFITFGGSTQVAIAQVDVHINVLLEMMDGTIGIELPDAVRNTFLPIKE